MIQYLKDLGPELINKGYHIVPIKPGTKYPKGLTNWQSIKATQKDVTRWSANGFNNGGVGVLCGSVIGVDIDILDTDIAEKVADWCRENLGTAPQRIGLNPKILFVFRTEKPFSKLTSKTYTDMFDFNHKVEVLGSGQQFVAYAKHPDTKRPYQWVNGPGLSDLAFNDLPLITVRQAQELIKYFESIIPSDWLAKAGTSSKFFDSPDSDDDDPFADVILRADISLERIKTVLKETRVLADDRDEWIKFGQALHHQFSGSAEGLELYEEWSSHSGTYRDGQDGGPDEKWASFSTKGRPLSFRYILKKHNEIKAFDDIFEISDEGTLLDQFLEKYVFVENGNMVADLTKPPQYCLSKIDEFKNRTANKRHEVPAPTIADPEKTKLAPVWASWLVNTGRKDAQGSDYSPFKDRYFTDDYGHSWINTFYMPEFPSRDGDLKIFHEHIAYLFPCPVERKWFLDWMAFNIQYPGKRSKVTPLHISVNHGTGRGWVVELMGFLLGQWNCTKTKMDVLSGEGSAGQYQDYLVDSLLCCVEEVREKDKKRYGISEKIRDILTENYLEVNAKFGGKGTREIYTNFFFMSNHTDAFVLTKEDRRIQVLWGPKEFRDEAYYDRLYEWLVPGNVGLLAQWLKARDISKFNWKRATDTPGRSRMIDSNRTPTETAFWDFINEVGRTAITYQKVISKVGTYMEGDDFDAIPDEKQILRLLKQHAMASGLVKFEGKPVRPWLIGVWDSVDNEEIRSFLTTHGNTR